MKGRSIALSGPRRIIADVCYFAGDTTKGVISRRLGLGPLARVLAQLPRGAKPLWPAMIARAYGLVAADMPELRRAYVKFPWPHIYEYPMSVSMIATERVFDGEPTLFFVRMKGPEHMSLGELAERLRRAKSVDWQEERDFRRVFAIASLPLPLRRLIWWLGLNIGRQRANYFGTFGISSLAGQGATITNAVHMFTVLLSYGAMADDGSLELFFSFDHRAFDGGVVARALSRLEEKLNGPIVEEIISAFPHATGAGMASV